jgi:long-chain acyl-CoA synthetase
MTLEPWQVENGLLTPTMKLKRNELQKRFADKIAELYAKSSPQ